MREVLGAGDNARQFERNCALIQLHHISNDEATRTTSSAPIRDWDTVKAKLNEWSFQSITKEGTWEKFVQSFDPLFG